MLNTLGYLQNLCHIGEGRVGGREIPFPRARYSPGCNSYDAELVVHLDFKECPSQAKEGLDDNDHATVLTPMMLPCILFLRACVDP